MAAETALKFRHELKYELPLGEARVLSERLARIFVRDCYSGEDGSYRVTSLYLDTPSDLALREKIDGVSRREKFRIRFYGERPDFIRLEKKMKINGLTAKRQARLTLEEVEKILAGERDFLLAKTPLEVELHAKMRRGLAPRTVVCYDREAFVFAPGNVRITLDRNLRTDSNPREFTRPSRLPIGVSDSCAVLELKYDEYLPELVKMAVATPTLTRTAYSKYAVCRKFD